jgi:hypothetical protein
MKQIEFMTIKISYIIAFILIGNWIYSQDSIRFKDNNVITTKISEVGITDVKYHRFDNLDGPLYIVNKQDIRYIKFANGIIDTIKSIPQPISNTFINMYNNDNKLHIGDRYRIIYNYHTLGEKELKELIMDIPQKTSRDLLLKDFALMKHYKVNQYLLGYSSIGFGVAGYMGAIIFDTSYNRTSSSNYSIFASIAAGGIGLIATQILSRIERKKRYSLKLEIARKYNNL